MQEIKDILEEIERPRNKDELVPAWWIRAHILSFVDQALAKLKEEPEPTEFTKEWRKRFVESESFMAISGAKESQIMEEMRKACKIIDQLQAEIKSQDEHIELLHQCDDSATEVIAKMDSEIENLQAEIKKLVEGQQAMKEAGS